MTTYSYRAISREGVEIRGVVQAADEFAAAGQIRERCPIITSLKPVQTGKLPALLSMELGSRRVKMKPLALLCSQFAITLRSGMPVGRAMEMIARQTEDRKLRRVLSEAAEDIRAGSTVASALRKFEGVFPETFIETISAGEHAGTLDESFRKLHSYYEKGYRTSEKIRSAMTYPSFVILVAIVVLIIVMAKVVPALTQTFAALGGELPMITRLMIASSAFFADWWIFLLFLLLLFVTAWKLYTRTERGRRLAGRLQLLLPVIGRINLMNGAAQFANTLSVMLGAGLTINNAVTATANTLDNDILAEEVLGMTAKIEEGHPIGECIRQSAYFPDTLKEMCAVGEETGDLDRTLEVVGSYFSNEADFLTQQALARLEPTLLILLALFAGFIVFSIYLPMFTMYDLM